MTSYIERMMNKFSTERETAYRATPLSSATREVLGQLFVQGPTWDGNLISKSGRDDLMRRGLADSYDGWQWLNEAGVKLALRMDVRESADQRWYRKQSHQ